MELTDAPESRGLTFLSQAPALHPPVPVVVSAEGLTKSFTPRRRMRDVVRFGGRSRPVTVVDHVTIEIRGGEIFGLLGPNGAGKTTIFKMLSTMIAPDRGSARVAGFDVVREAEAVRALLANVPADDRSLNWRLSAYENLRLFAALQQVPRMALEGRIRRVLRTVSLEDARGVRVAEFSSGMKQRLLIARALLTEPEILLLDEPTRTLDPLSARELRRFLREELVGAHGCTILLATHNADEAFGFCDRVAVLHRGRVLATGPAAELATRFGEDRYRIVTSGSGHVALAALERGGLLVRAKAAEPTREGWDTTECVISGGPSRSASVLAALVDRGVGVARLERIEPSLADLISRIIGADAGDGRDA